MERPTVLVTRAEFERAPETFRSTADFNCVVAPDEEHALAAAVRTAAVRDVVIGHRRYVGALYAALPERGVLARFGVGHDGVDKRQATEAGLGCTNTPSVLDQSVAEFTIALILAAARHVPAMTAATRDGQWRLVQGTELRGRRLAVIGCGQIGQAVARIASAGFGMSVHGCHRPGAPPRGTRAEPFTTLTDDFAAAVEGADVVTIHIPASADNHGFVNAARLAWLPQHAWLVNTARGQVLDERALFDALAAGRLAGAALDVYEREPYEPVDEAHDLRRLSNVLLTPHAGSHTTAANRGMAERALQNIRWAHAGEYGRMDLLNRDVLARWGAAGC